MKLDDDRIRAKLHDISKALSRLERFQRITREDFLSDEDSQDIAECKNT